MDDHGNELAGVSIAIEDGWITRVGEQLDPSAFDDHIDCSHVLAIPGLVNTHHHLYQTLTRAFPQSEGRRLFPWLEMLYPIWAGLDEEMIYASTRAGLAALALSGCTTCADHLYVFPPGGERFVDAQVLAAGSVGVRFHPTRGSMDLGQSDGGLPPDSVVQSRETILRDSERVIDLYHDPEPGAMVQIGLAPCSPFSVTAELMRESAELARARKVRLHTHIAETLEEDKYSRREYNLSPIELLDHLGWVEDDVWLAHCVHISDSEIEIMAARGASVAHCPTSNMLLGSGLAPVASMLGARVGVGLGVDGSASNDGNDLRQEMKQAVLVARARDGASALSARQALWLATRGGAECLGRTDIGCIATGKVADLVLYDTGSLECSGGQEDLVAAVVLGTPRPTAVFVNGEVVVRHGDLVTCDRDEVAWQQNEASSRLLKRWREAS